MAGLLFAVLVVGGEMLWVFGCWQKGRPGDGRWCSLLAI